MLDSENPAMKQCQDCLKYYPLAGFKKKTYENNRVCITNYCNKCYNLMSNRHGKMWQLRKRLERELAEAPYKTVESFLKKDPDLLIHVIGLIGKHKYLPALKHEQSEVIHRNLQFRKKRLSERPDHDPDEAMEIFYRVVRKMGLEWTLKK